MKKSTKLQKGFTLIEFLIVITLIGIISFSSAPFLARFFTQNAVANTSDMLVGELRKAQAYAMSGRQNGDWGIHLGTNQFILFQGTTYATRNTAFDEISSFANPVTISGFTDIIFTHTTGTPSASPTITITGDSNTSTLTINGQGVVSR